MIDKFYVFDDEGQEMAWDFDSMKDCVLNSPEEYWEEDYRDITNFNNLKDWWDNHYDPKGMAMSSSFHYSIMDDVLDGIKIYNKYEDPKLGKVTKAYENEYGDWVIKIQIIGDDLTPNAAYDSLSDEIEENFFYRYRGVGIKGCHVNEDEREFVLVYSKDCLKSGRF